MIDSPPPAISPVGAMVLAAGASRRLGQPKQLVQKDGESLLRRTARIAVDSGCSPVVVVLGSQADLLAPEVAGLAVETVFNSEWETGMASSIRRGMEAVAERRIDQVMVLVCDQPLLTEPVLRALIAGHAGPSGAADITASSYNGTKGVPAIFSRAVFPSLMQLSGDEGARKIIGQPRWRVVAVEFPGGGVDIDEPPDLESAVAE